MTDADDRIARLTELARKAWPDSVFEDEDDALPAAITFDGLGYALEDDNGMIRALLMDHPRALDALEAALCVLAVEAPRWAVELAAKWQGEADEAFREGQAIRLGEFNPSWVIAGNIEALIGELLAAAKGKP